MEICFFFFNDTATTEIYTLSLHDALPISIFQLPEYEQRGNRWQPLPPNRHDGAGQRRLRDGKREHYCGLASSCVRGGPRSEEHTSELQSPCNLACRLPPYKKTL